MLNPEIEKRPNFYKIQNILFYQMNLDAKFFKYKYFSMNKNKYFPLKFDN